MQRTKWRVHKRKLERWTGARACGLLIAMFRNSSLKINSNEKSLMDFKLGSERWLEGIDDMIGFLFEKMTLAREWIGGNQSGFK